MQAERGSRIDSDPTARLRVLVVLASYGTANDGYLLQLIQEYRSMSFHVDLVILSNLKKQLAPDIEVLVGLPNRNPWSLPFLHKKVFADRLELYDLFVYSEDDMLITEKNLRSFLEVTAVLREQEIAGFLRIEHGSRGNVNYPEVHGHFHWDPTSVRSRGAYTLANFTNEHAAFYVLTQSQLRKCIRSGGFLVDPHEGKYDLPCSAATDPYTQCGFEKLVPISHLDNFTIHHLSNKYIGKMGVDGPELDRQIDTLLHIGKAGCKPAALFTTETKLWRGMYSKDYYEPAAEDVISMISQRSRSVLSIGCGWGESECRLAEKGLRVVAVPLDPIICRRAAASGVEMVPGDFRTAKTKLEAEKFDCILYLNVLHLVRNPIEVLSLFRDNLSPKSEVIIQTPNMLSVPAIRSSIRLLSRLQNLPDYDVAGVHFSFIRKVRNWCHRSGLRVDTTLGVFRQGPEPFRNRAYGSNALCMAREFITVAQKR